MNKSIIARIVIILILPMILWSCATLFGNNNREISIVSIPNGADIYMDGVFYGRTPGSVLIPNVGPYGQKISLRKNGYQDATFLVNTEFQNVGYWNIIVFPVFFVDAISGCMFKVKPEDYNMRIILSKIESQTQINEIN